MDNECPACKRDDEAGIKLMFSNCGHQLCEDCLKKMFKTVTQIACPICRRDLRRGDFSSKFHDEREFERELAIRKDVISVLNKNEEEFASIEEYYDYLEYIEDTIFSIMRGNIEESTNLTKLREVNQMQIQSSSIRMEQNMRILKHKALLHDSEFNEHLKDQAMDIDNPIDDNARSYIVKDMPDCLNIDPDYSLDTMDCDFKLMFLQASGFNHEAEYKSGISELRDSLCIL